jgi:hypothetical protein
MPRKWRPGKARHSVRIVKASVQHWLDTGDLGLAERENVWLAFSLRFDGDTLRAALAAADPAAGDALLATIPASHNFFL